MVIMKKAYNAVVNWINGYINLWEYRKKVKEANRLHVLTGKRYHVVPNNDKGLMVIDNTFIDNYNRHVKGKHKKITINDLLKMSYYSTPVKGLSR